MDGTSDPAAREATRLIGVGSLALAAAISEAYFLQRPRDARAWHVAARHKLVQDTIRHLQFLSVALAVGEPKLFVHHVGWARIFLQKRNLGMEILEVTLQCITSVLEGRLSTTAARLCRSYIEAGLAGLQNPHAVEQQPNSRQLSQLTKLYLDALFRANRRDATSIVMRALDAGMDVRDIYLRVFQAAEYEVGRLWHTNEILIAQAHYYTAITQSIISLLYPRIFSAEPNGRRLVATCAFAEKHEIGIRMVSDFFEMEGWDTCFLGALTSSHSVMQAIVEKEADLLLLSVTTALHLTIAKRLIGLVRSSDACSGVKVLVGGNIFNMVPDLWKKMGADGYARDAAQAVIVARSLFEQESAATSESAP
jgi:methanogenic corrinoid protein MtbC1